MSTRLLYAIQLVGLLVAYLVTARLGLQLDAVSGFATLVWPPSGIALAALFLFGTRLWPAVAAGAFLVNATAGAPLGSALGIAAGNTLEALIGVYFLRRAKVEPSLARVRDVLALILLGAIASTLVSATIGVLSLWPSGVLEAPAWPDTWRAWWVGDALGDLIVAPLVLVWATAPRLDLHRRRLVEAAALLFALVLVSLRIFHGLGEGNDSVLRHPYLLFPVLVWAAMRFRQHGAATATFVASVMAVAGTVLGHGPFVREDLSESLLLLQTFMGIVAITALILAAAIAERDRSGAQLQARELDLRLVTDAAPILISLVNTNQRFRYNNKAYEDWFGVPVDTVRGKHLREVLGGRAYDAIRPHLEAVLSGQPVHFETLLPYQGTPRHVSATFLPRVELDGSVGGFVAFVQDMTARKLGEQALQKSEEQFRLLADASQSLSQSLDYKITLDALSKVVVPQFADWYSAELVEPDGTRSQIVVAHSDPAKVQLARELREKYPPSPDAPTGVPQVLRTGKAQLYPEIPDALLRAGAQSEEHYRLARELGLRSAMLVPLRARGRVFGVLTLVSAESGRRYTESDLALAEELGRRAALAVDNAKLYQEAQEAIEDAREAIRARDEFLSIASHELRTPLTALELQVSMLARAAAKIEGSVVPAEKVTAKVEVIGRQVERLTGLIESLLDVSRAVAGRLELQPEDTSFKAVVEDVAGRLREQIDRAGCRFVFRAEDACVGRWDRLRLDQIVTNLLSNAVKYGRGKPIEILLHCHPDTAVLIVRDQGIGISAEDQARIFERFERAVSSRHFGGLGLGLWIVKQIVTAMRGTISVQSESGTGSTFTVTLPKLSPLPSEAKIPGDPQSEDKGPTVH
jgi:PAS domain S-box-containing protein